MAKERLKSPRVRLFIALDLPEEVKAGIWRWGDRALADSALRRIVPESLHITLAFLGWRPAKEVERLGEILEESVGPAPLIELRDPEPRPPRGRPRIFALPALSPGAELLQSDLQERLVEGHFYEAEKRQYWPHVTVARVRAEARGSKRPARVEKAPGKLSAALAEAFLGVRLTLYRSELQPAGARYVPLAQVELPGAGRQ
jgi:RNA 2',3'-cyclic 3'-phosphodiesterase